MKMSINLLVIYLIMVGCTKDNKDAIPTIEQTIYLTSGEQWQFDFGSLAVESQQSISANPLSAEINEIIYDSDIQQTVYRYQSFGTFKGKDSARIRIESSVGDDNYFILSDYVFLFLVE